MRRRGDGVGLYVKKLLPLLIIDVRRVVFDLQERNRRRAVVQLRFIKIRVEPHVEAVAVLVERLPIMKSPGRRRRQPHRQAHPALTELEPVWKSTSVSAVMELVSRRWREVMIQQWRRRAATI